MTPLSSNRSEELLLCSCGAEDPEEVINIILHDFSWWKMFNDFYGLGMVNQLGKPNFCTPQVYILRGRECSPSCVFKITKTSRYCNNECYICLLYFICYNITSIILEQKTSNKHCNKTCFF